MSAKNEFANYWTHIQMNQPVLNERQKQIHQLMNSIWRLYRDRTQQAGNKVVFTKV